MYFTTSSVLPGDRRQQRSHELDRIVRLQIRRVIGQQRIGGRVRFVESVSGELRHQVENLFNLLWRITPLHRALDEAFALLRHFFGLLLAHGAPQQIGLAQGVARQAVRDLHHLFLVDDHAPGFFQDFLQFRQFVFDLLASVFAIDEVIDHAALDRSRDGRAHSGR